MYSMILAMDKNNVIGNKNALPWDLPDDLLHFKRKTLSKIVVMGKNTFDSIGRALPNRKNVVITSDKTFQADNVIVFHDLEELHAFAKQQKEEIIFIGGANLLKQVYDKIDTLYLTHIYESFEGDCSIDFIDNKELTLCEIQSFHKSDGHKYDYSFCTYKKK